MAAALFAESFQIETGASLREGYGAHDFWQDNCVVICIRFEPSAPDTV